MSNRTSRTTLRKFICSCSEDTCPRWEVVKVILDRSDRLEAELEDLKRQLVAYQGGDEVLTDLMDGNEP